MPNTSSNGPFACNRPSRHEGALLQTSEVALDCLFSSALSLLDLHNQMRSFNSALLQ